MILLFSGGLDSYIAWEYLNRPRTLYVNIGHKYASFEEGAVHNLIPSTIVDHRLNLSDWEEPDANIPMRNAFLCMIASHYEKEICLVVQKGEMTIPDRSKHFMWSFSSWLSWMRGGSGYKIFTPFEEMTKTQMVAWYKKKGLPINRLLDTRSCFSGEIYNCGQCAACFRRWVALVNNGLDEPYESPILKWKGVQEYVTKMKEGKYDELRTEETFNALKSAGYQV